MSTQSNSFVYTPTSSGTYTWRFRRVCTGATAPASSYTVDNLKVSYVIPYTRTECPETDLAYRFGFNGKEKDLEVDGQQDYGLRIYDNRLGRFKSVDPLSKSYPFYTPYQFSGNNPVRFIDLDGGEPSLPELEVINKGLQAIYDFPSNLGTKINETLTNATKYSPFRENGTVVIDHTTEAFTHYYRGGGETVQLGPKTIANIQNSEKVKEYRANLQSGKTTSPAKPIQGKLPVNMTFESARTFHLGEMTLDYKTKCNTEQCTTTFTVDDNGFVDPNFPGEYTNKGLNKVGLNIESLNPDNHGSNLEAGGTTYDYKPVKWSETYKNPGYKTDNQGNPQPIKKETKKE
jgi:RHS repeat-associated protein